MLSCSGGMHDIGWPARLELVMIHEYFFLTELNLKLVMCCCGGKGGTGDINYAAGHVHY